MLPDQGAQWMSSLCEVYIRRQGPRDDTHQQRISERSWTKNAEVRFVRISFLEEMVRPACIQRREEITLLIAVDVEFLLFSWMGK